MNPFYAKIKFTPRPLQDISLGNCSWYDYPKFCDAYIEAAVWADTNEPLTDEELEIINEDSQLVHEIASTYLI